MSLYVSSVDDLADPYTFLAGRISVAAGYKTWPVPVAGYMS